ncbi:MAG: hypothetical protein KGJ60_13455 [Verrucomicrobiota bacterium]|nr:hypothetical protein [Verrucomicrobiota bacterium]
MINGAQFVSIRNLSLTKIQGEHFLEVLRQNAAAFDSNDNSLDKAANWGCRGHMQYNSNYGLASIRISGAQGGAKNGFSHISFSKARLLHPD